MGGDFIDPLAGRRADAQDVDVPGEEVRHSDFEVSERDRGKVEACQLAAYVGQNAGSGSGHDDRSRGLCLR